jgi:ribonuclease P protein component
VISAIRGRSELQSATRRGSRIAGSVLWCTWSPDPEASSTSVAYAIPRAYGPAVRRNRLRRRLRSVLAESDREQSLPPGVLLVGPHRRVVDEITYEQVRSDVVRFVGRLRSGVPPR